MKFRHKCTEARWNETTSKWHVKFDILDSSDTTISSIEDIADVFITGSGALNSWKYPDIPGIDTFKGKLMHSAAYDSSHSIKDQNIAVIGAGSSGIQIVPTIQPQVKRLDHYVRGKTWIAASFGHELVEAREGHDGNFKYTPEEIQAWRADPASYIAYRKALEVGMQSGFALCHKNSPEHTSAWRLFEELMKQRLAQKPWIADHMIPEFAPLCKRLTPGPGYLEALCKDNVDVIPHSASRITQTGIVDDQGTLREVDTIICATGFDTSFQGRFPVYGRNGENLQDRYRVKAETYLSLTTDGFPNYFQSLGPNAGRGNGNLLIVVEASHHYFGQILRKLSSENVRTVEVKRKPVQDFTGFCDAFFQRTVFSEECGSWYKTLPVGEDPRKKNTGRITALWPGSNVHQIKALERVRWDDYEMTSCDENEFGWFGNGWSVAERDGDDEGMSWYLRGTNLLHEKRMKEGLWLGGHGDRLGEGMKETNSKVGAGKLDEKNGVIEGGIDLGVPNIKTV